MKTYKSILLQIVILLLLSQLSFSQEVEVNLGGNSTSDAFVVKDSSGNVLLKMDGDQNFGINTEQPDGIEIKGRDAHSDQEDGDSIKIIGGSTWPLGESYNFGGSISILGGSAANGGGSVSILGGTGDSYGGSVIISSGSSDNGGGASGGVHISTCDAANSPSGHINLSTGWGEVLAI